MGTPNEETWPGVSLLPDFNRNFEKFPGESLRNLIPRIDDVGFDLLNRMLQLNPSQRISAADALTHPYLLDIPESITNMN